MESLPILQKIMGGTLTAGFFAHDFYYTNKYLGLGIAAIVFLISVLSFHIMIYCSYAGIAEITTVEDRRKVERIRMIMSAFTIMFCLADILDSLNSPGQGLFTLKECLTTLLSLAIVIFPEAAFRIIFLFKKRRVRNR